MNGWAALAAGQYGVITRAQLRVHLSDRQIDRMIGDQLEPLHRGTFRVAGSYPSARQRAMAVCLWCGDDALLSHGTAAELLRLPIRSDPTIHVTAPPHVRRRAQGVTVHRSERLDRFLVDGLPATSPARTIIDLAASLDAEALEDVFERARRLGLVTPSVFAREMDRLGGRGRPGSATVREMLQVTGQRPTESRLETKTARLLRACGLHPDATQHRVGPYRLDFVWLRRMLALECDGFDWHGGRLAWKRDRRRIAYLEARGWDLVHVTWDDVTRRPDETIERLRLKSDRISRVS